MARLEKNIEKNGLEIYFESIPSEEIRDEMKGLGFRWHRAKKCWYAKETTLRLKFSSKVCGQTETKTATSRVKTTSDSTPTVDFSIVIMTKKC